MAAHSRSLFQYLAQRNPALNLENGGKGKNTTSRKGTWKVPRIITDWNDFRPESLSNIYGGQLKQILSMHVPCPEPPSIAPFPFREIHDEASLEGFLTLWSQQIVSNALRIAQDKLESLRTSGRVYMARGGQAELLESRPRNDKKRRSHPDWAAVIETIVVNEKQPKLKPKLKPKRKPKLKLKNVLPGDTKLSSKWTSSMVQKGDQGKFLKHPNTVSPVIQVFNYCLQANARYGFIITDEELVVLRIGVVESSMESHEQEEREPEIDEFFSGFAEDEANGEVLTSYAQESQDSQTVYISEAQKRARRSGKVELMSIPWEYCGSDSEPFDSVLTVNLALWWLHILAGTASDIELEYPSLSEEKFPTTRSPNNDSFNAGIEDLNLAASSFSTHDGDREKSARKRKPDPSSTPRAKSAKRKLDLS